MMQESLLMIMTRRSWTQHCRISSRHGGRVVHLGVSHTATPATLLTMLRLLRLSGLRLFLPP